MKIIDKANTINWFSNRGMMEQGEKLLFNRYPAMSRFSIPVDAGKKTVMAKTIASLYSGCSESLLWINEFGIWPSCEDWKLFNGFRSSIGENSPLYEKPGHVFSMEDIDTVGSLLAMVLYFFWGAVVISDDANFAVRISHDEYIDVYAANQSTLSGVMERLTLT